MFSYILPIFLVIFINPGESRYGDKCEFSSKCEFMEKCRNGRCECNIGYFLEYNYKAVATCEPKFSNIQCNQPCPSDQVCEDSYCVCSNSSQIIINGECINKSFQNFMDKCYKTNNTAYICNYENNSFCNNQRCVCFGDYFYNKTSEVCEVKKNYMDLHNISQYKARPEEYCLNKNDCIDGLRCLPQYVCDCPITCPYNKSHKICDCGKISFEVPLVPVVTGFILGILSIVFWIFIIRKTIKGQKKRNEVVILDNLNERHDSNNSEPSNTPVDIPASSPPYPIDSLPKIGMPPLGFDRNIDAPPPYTP